MQDLHQKEYFHVFPKRNIYFVKCIVFGKVKDSLHWEWVTMFPQYIYFLSMSWSGLLYSSYYNGQNIHFWD